MDSTTTQALDDALELLNAKRGQEAAKVLAKLVTRDPGNERAWHMLSFALSEPEKQIYALRRVLQINPHNRPARSWLKRLEQEPAPVHLPVAGDPAPQLPAAPAAEPLLAGGFARVDPGRPPAPRWPADRAGSGGDGRRRPRHTFPTAPAGRDQFPTPRGSRPVPPG